MLGVQLIYERGIYISTQLTLLQEPVSLNPESYDDFYQALHQRLINNINLEWGM